MEEKVMQIYALVITVIAAISIASAISLVGLRAGDRDLFVEHTKFQKEEISKLKNAMRVKNRRYLVWKTNWIRQCPNVKRLRNEIEGKEVQLDADLFL